MGQGRAISEETIKVGRFWGGSVLDPIAPLTVRLRTPERSRLVHESSLVLWLRVLRKPGWFRSNYGEFGSTRRLVPERFTTGMLEVESNFENVRRCYGVHLSIQD